MDTGWKRPGSASTVDAGSYNWSNTSYATDGQNDLGATCAVGAGGTSDHLILHNFGFGIPSGTTIRGIEVRIRSKSAGGTADVTQTVTIYKTATTLTTPGDDLVDSISSSFETNSGGGNASLWGLTWTYTELNSSTFGFGLQGVGGVSLTRTWEIDNLEAKVYYTIDSYTSGWKDGTASGSVDTSTNTAWSSTANALDSDTDYASGAITGDGVNLENTDTLIVYDFNFNVPSGYMPTGLEVEVTSAFTNTTYNATIAAFFNKTVSTTPTGNSPSSLSEICYQDTAFTTVTEGAWNDLFGMTLTRDDVNAESFGLVIYGKSKYVGNIYVRYARAKVYYEPETSEGGDFFVNF